MENIVGGLKNTREREREESIFQKDQERFLTSRDRLTRFRNYGSNLIIFTCSRRECKSV